jgi:hypothetical protein
MLAAVSTCSGLGRSGEPMKTATSTAAPASAIPMPISVVGSSRGVIRAIRATAASTLDGAAAGSAVVTVSRAERGTFFSSTTGGACGRSVSGMGYRLSKMVVNWWNEGGVSARDGPAGGS